MKKQELINKYNRKQHKQATIDFSSIVVEYVSFYLVFTSVKTESRNTKTGDVYQTYLIDKERINEKSVFGAKCVTCPIVNDCYVSRDKLAVRSALKKAIKGLGKYKFMTLEKACEYLTNKKLRFGSYGDPSILPLSDIEMITKACKSWLGYTHYWKDIPTQYAKYFMASVENKADKLLANSLGYRAFEVFFDDDILIDDDSVLCPNFTHNIQCKKCGLCDGKHGLDDKRKNICIPSH
tara:strand:+ start:917 stop:1627 length:711 start_codon:yes stop_codon:yes gene_type:complete